MIRKYTKKKSYKESTKLNKRSRLVRERASDYEGGGLTTDLSLFGTSELEDTIVLLQAIVDGNLPDDFEEDDVNVVLNRNSGYVFLSNSNYDTAMLNNETGKVESWYNLPYGGFEGFYSDIIDEFESYPDEFDSEDVEYIRDLAERKNDTRIVKLCNEYID